ITGNVSKKVVTSNEKGEFVISLAKTDKILNLSRLGYIPKAVPVGTKSIIEVQLETSMDQLEEVVVIGYGTVERKDLTGAVGSVNMEDLQKAPVKTFDEALA